MMTYEEYAVIFKALADESRLKIVEMLCGGELCACKILESFDITQPTLSYHMKTLCDSGIVESRRDGAWMRYTVNREKLEEIKGFFNLPKTGEAAASDADCCH
jgi:ArsR family transcriptional regulator, arsenate/arsenite/antimonite-responsive transcriptional repressor